MRKLSIAILLFICSACSGDPSLEFPVKGKGMTITSGYGYRADPFTGKRAFHNGVDIAAQKGAKILASASGDVRSIKYHKDLGMVIVVDHDDFETVYAHLKESYVGRGQSVSVGEEIGVMGNTGRSTGRHLHFVVTIDGKSDDPLKFMTVPNNVRRND